VLLPPPPRRDDQLVKIRAAGRGSRNRHDDGDDGETKNTRQGPSCAILIDISLRKRIINHLKTEQQGTGDMKISDHGNYMPGCTLSH
jgi:hypothetical protein